MKIIPTKKQFLSWGMLGIITYLSFAIGIISLLLPVIDTSEDLSKPKSIQNKMDLSTELCQTLKDNPSVKKIAQYKNQFPSKKCKIDKPIKAVNGKDYFAVSIKLLAKHKNLTKSILENSEFSAHSKYYLLTLLDNTKNKDVKEINTSVMQKDFANKLNKSVSKYFTQVSKYYDKCESKEDIMSSYQIFSDIIYEDVVGKKLQTNDDLLRLKFDIPDYIFKNHTILRSLILTSKAMDKKARQHWFDKSKIMNNQQIEKLYCILLNGRARLDNIGAKYEGISTTSINNGVRSKLKIIEGFAIEGFPDKALSSLQKISTADLKNDFQTVIFILKKIQREDLIVKKYTQITGSFQKNEYFSAQKSYGVFLLKNNDYYGHNILNQCAMSAMQNKNYDAFISCSKSNAFNRDDDIAYKSFEYVNKAIPEEYWAKNNNEKSNVLGNMGWYLIKMNKPYDAIKKLESSLKYEHQSWVYMNLGHAYYLIGEKKKALGMYKEKLNEDSSLRQDLIKDYDIFLKNSLVNADDVNYIKNGIRKVGK